MKLNLYVFPRHRMIGGNTRINGGWPDSAEGRLIAVKSDHLVLDAGEGGIAYYPADHVKSITISGYESKERYIAPPYIESDDFAGVLAVLKERSVQINRDGPGELQGVIGSCFPDHILLVQDHEITCVFIRHIHSIGLAAMLASGEVTAAVQAAPANQVEAADEAPAAIQREITADVDAKAGTAEPASNIQAPEHPTEETHPSQESQKGSRTFHYSIRTTRTIRTIRSKGETRRARAFDDDRNRSSRAKIHIWHPPSTTARKPSRKLAKKRKNINGGFKLQSSNRSLFVWLSPVVTRGKSA